MMSAVQLELGVMLGVRRVVMSGWASSGSSGVRVGVMSGGFGSGWH